MSTITRLTDIQLSFLRVNPLSDVSLLDALTSFAYVRRYAPFLSAFHLAVSSNAVEVRYAVVRFNRVGIKPTFRYCLLKRTSKIVFYHNLGLESGPNFRWQYIITQRPVYEALRGIQDRFGGEDGVLEGGCLELDTCVSVMRCSSLRCRGSVSRCFCFRK